jgi:hypothetical protein
MASEQTVLARANLYDRCALSRHRAEVCQRIHSLQYADVAEVARKRCSYVQHVQ